MSIVTTCESYVLLRSPEGIPANAPRASCRSVSMRAWLFDPVQLVSLYPRRTVALVDGGVHDNQGISGILEQECAIAM